MQRIVQSVILILIRWIVIYPMDSAIRRFLNNRSLIGQNLTGEFIRKFMQHLETCLLTTEADRVLCHLVMFNCLFLLDVQNEIQLLSWFFYYSWLVCLLFEKCTACQSHRKWPISDGIVFKNELTHFTLLDARKRVEKSPAPTGEERCVTTLKTAV